MDTKESKKIEFNFEGVDYTLMYTVASIRKMARDGFDFNAMERDIPNVGYDLFSGAFIAKHSYVPVKERERIYEQLVAENEDGQNLLGCLLEMASDELEFIVTHPQGNVKWAMV